MKDVGLLDPLRLLVPGALTAELQSSAENSIEIPTRLGPPATPNVAPRSPRSRQQPSGPAIVQVTRQKRFVLSVSERSQSRAEPVRPGSDGFHR